MGVLGFGAYVQPVLYPQVTERFFYKAMVIGSVVPVLIVLLISLRVLGKDRPRLRAPLVFGLAATLTVLAGTVAGALSTFSSLSLVGTTWQQGQYELVVIGAGLLGGFGALVLWGPKIWGRRLSELAASALGLLLFLDDPADGRRQPRRRPARPAGGRGRTTSAAAARGSSTSASPPARSP